MPTLFARLTLRVNHVGGQKLCESVSLRGHSWLNCFFQAEPETSANQCQE